MRNSLLGVLALAFGLQPVDATGPGPVIAPRACSRTVTAKGGDTCASLASAGGITVSQFLQANPSISSCSQLTTGATYCLDGAAPGATSTAAAAPTGPPTKVSSDGTCGLNNLGVAVTCVGSKWGDCCSQHNFCGGTADYCGTGCVADFGNCGANAGGGGSSQSTPPTTSPVVTPVPPTTTPIVTPVPPPAQTTGTVWVTSTGTIFKTVTSVDVIRSTTTTTVTADGGTATGTIYVRSTITVTSTALTSATSTVIVTSTSLRLSTSQVVRTSTTVQTDTLTTITTVTLTKTVTTAIAACNGGGTSYQEPTILTTIIPTGRPTPTQQPGQTRPPTNLILPGTPSTCTKFDQIAQSDNCLTIARRNSINLRDFERINPSIDCDNLWVGYYVCVG